MTKNRDLKQAMFTKALNGVMKQKGVAYDFTNLACFYRREVEGELVHCSIGHLVKSYNTTCVQGPVQAFPEHNPGVWAKLKEENGLGDNNDGEWLTWLYHLQRVHDDSVVKTINHHTNFNADMVRLFKKKFMVGMQEFAITHFLAVVLED